MACTLVSTKVAGISFINKLVQSGQIQLESGFTMNLNFTKEGDKCVARMVQEVKDKEHPDQFRLQVELIGAFECVAQTQEQKRQVHVEAYDAMFPFMQVQVQQICAFSGVPGFMLRKSIINPEKVNVAANPAAAAAQQPKEVTLPIV